MGCCLRSRLNSRITRGKLLNKWNRDGQGNNEFLSIFPSQRPKKKVNTKKLQNMIKQNSRLYKIAQEIGSNPPAYTKSGRYDHAGHAVSQFTIYRNDSG